MDRSLLRREVRRLGARQTFYELVGQQIIDAVRELPPFVTPKPPKPLPLKGQSEEEAVLLISDVQAGMVVDVRESGGLGRYTSEILVDQINTLRDTVLSICARYHPNVRRLNIFFLGDIIEGQAIFPGQLRSIDMHAVQQVLFCWERFAEFQAALARHFQEVRCWGTCGNHGRVSGRPGEFSPLSNFDYLLYMMWQQRLSSVKNIKWTVAQSWWDIADVCGFRFLLVHGDDTVGWAGVPFYGLLRHKARYRELFTTLRREHGDFDYLTVGHHSVLAQFNGIYMNGSWPGGTEFSLKRLQLGDVPGQKLMGVHPRWGVSWTRDLLLRPLPPRAPEQESR